MATQFELWKQAIAQMESAIAELDQAHATLKDIGFDDLEGDLTATVSSPYRLDARAIVSVATDLLTSLKDETCPDCYHALRLHDDRYGCEYERGDVPMSTRDGGTVMAAAGPCYCQWGLEEASR